MLPAAAFYVFGNAGVERAIDAANDIDEPGIGGNCWRSASRKWVSVVDRSRPAIHDALLRPEFAGDNEAEDELARHNPFEHFALMGGFGLGMN